MQIEIDVGDVLEIILKDTDGGFKITFAKDVLQVETDFADTSGRVGVIYQESWDTLIDDGDMLPVDFDPKTDYDDRMAPLIAEYDTWLAAEGLTPMCAQELLAEDYIKPAQRQWLTDYVRRWDRAAVGA